MKARAPASVETVVAQRLGRLSPRVQRRLSRRPPIVIDGQRLEPDVQLMLALREYLGEPVWDETLTVEQARRLTREEAFLARGTRTVPVGAVEELTVEGLPARKYVSAEPGEKPLLVYLHGGGFVVGDLDTHDSPCRMLCRHAGVDVLAVEYRKAPETPFPGYVDDARTAFRWAASRYEHVAVAGDSAGGNLAATVAIEFDPELALLIYPVVDGTQERPSRHMFGKGFFLTDELMTWYTGHFMPEGSDPSDPLRSPILHPDLKDSAPCLIVTAGFDPLRDEGEAYAEKLRELGVKTVQRRFPGLFHGFINSTGASPSSRDALVEVAGMTRALLRSR
ncbi:alpha/beta hydrolase [Solirubrobacter ginsenosidimutans]|uniref:Alpha/beta hydrolase n=1 Tax=Solirubrobacter ginsenosidimutans TaxID=490573 RepID=A0A9X3MYY1_9ACTN|nr:alpha/beta hydrolase [Solirubrobacter ginsenosidimutans]MDA0165414.1 alpha/beta hydrolase [Solirubrobacter ginsenosidimutans]